MADRVAAVQSVTGGYGFNIEADGRPLKFITLTYETREDAMEARTHALKAVAKAISARVAG
jgi:hypothetical protein